LFDKREMVYYAEQMDELHSNYMLGDSSASFNFAFGLAIWDPSWDSLNNHYVEFIAQEHKLIAQLDDSDTIASHVATRKYDFEICAPDYLDRFLTKFM
jgi:hypothetical protein